MSYQFKKGDRVVVDKVLSPEGYYGNYRVGDCGVVMSIEDHYIEVDLDTGNRFQYSVHPDELTTEALYNSPLYKALA